MTFKGHFQLERFCDSVILLLHVLIYLIQELYASELP